MRIRAGILTKMQLNFVNNFNGCATEAAKAAGYKNPKESARQLMKNPTIMEAIRMKQNAFVEESGKRFGSEINCSRSAIINRMWDLAQLSPKDTKETIGGQMKALEVLSRVFDVRINRPADLDRLLEGKTQEEVDFFVEHGYFPEAPGPAIESNPQPEEPTNVQL